MAKRPGNEKQAGSRPNPTIRDAKAGLITQMSNPDVDPQDRIEQWGIRIGRSIGFLLTIGLILWFLSYLVKS